MTEVAVFAPGGYRFIRGVFQYSAGVAAEPGHRITRVMFPRPLPLAEGFAAAEGLMAAAQRPPTAFCACELRSPAPFTEQGFQAFNEIYVGTLSRWGIYDGQVNPVARSNVCPIADQPAEPSLYAFSFTQADDTAGAGQGFVVAGSAEAPEGRGSYRDHTVRLGDTSPGGLLEKARFVLGEMERRLGLLGFGWSATTAVQVYTEHDIHQIVLREIAVRGGAATHGITWHPCRPPVVDLDYEMDCRGLAQETLA